MNIELIKKYKTEFDHWLNGGKLLCSLKDDLKWMNANEVTWSFKDIECIFIIINDEFSELRKALCDGKTIQCNIIEGQSEQHWYAFKDKQWYNTTEFKYSIDKYRIKPEEPEFKVGDFVRDIISGKVSQVNNEDIVNGKYSQVIKWVPSYKELCWFTTRSAMLDGVNYAVLGYFNTIVGLYYTNTDGQTYRHCEPFLNSKPSWFKD